jgi:hypothetical protein
LTNRRLSAAYQHHQVATTGSFFGSIGLLLPADIAHTTIIPATKSMYAPRANVPNMAASHGFF